MLKYNLTVLCLLTSGIILGQGTKVPFKGANTIIITTTDADSTCYERLIRTLIDANFSIDVNNKEYYQLRTGPRAVPCLGCDQYTLNARVKQNEIFITANIQGNFSSGYRWSYTKNKMLKDFSVHEEIVKVLGSIGQLSYSKQ